MGREAGGFRIVNRPEGVPTSGYALLVVDGEGLPHMALSDFHVQMQRQVTDGAARSYLNALLPYFTYMEVDGWRQRRGDRWDGPPEAMRESVRDYRMQRLGCKVRRDGTCEVVHLTAQSPSTVRVVLSALKRFYGVAISTTLYKHENPLADPVGADASNSRQRDGAGNCRQVQNIRRAFSDSVEIREFFAACEAEFEFANRGGRADQHGQVDISGPVATEFLTIIQRKKSAMQSVLRRHPSPGVRDQQKYVDRGHDTAMPRSSCPDN